MTVVFTLRGHHFIYILQKCDRRSNYILSYKLSKWQDVVPTMMSDEDVGDDTFQVDRQEWESQEMINFFDQLDRRADTTVKCTHGRTVSWELHFPQKKRRNGF